jgi:hypothetical protein
VINFIPGLLLINEGLFHKDAINLAQAVEKTYQTGTLQMAVLGRMGAVLVNAVLYFPFYLAGQNADFVTRFSSVLFQALSAVAAYLFVKSLLKDRNSAFFAALLFSFTPFYFVPNTYGKEHGLSMFFMLMSFYALHRGIRRQSFWLMALASVLFAFAVSVRESVLVMLPVYVLLYILPLGIDSSESALKYSSRFMPRALAAFLVPLTVGLGVLWVMYLGPIVLPVVSGNTDSAIYGLNGLFSFQVLIAFNDLLTGVTPYVMAIALLAAVIMWKAGERAMLVFLGCWAGLFFLFANAGNYVARHLDVIIVPIYILVGYALGRMARRSWLTATSLAVCGALLMFTYMYPILAFRHAFDGEKRFALFVAALTEPDAVIITEDQHVFMTYYGQRKVLWLPVNNADLMGAFVSHVNALLKKGVPVYCTYSAYLPNDEQLRTVSDHFQVMKVGAFVSEDYHRADMRFRFHTQKLYRVLASKDKAS